MSRTYLILPKARADIDDAYDWYESQRVSRGDEFLLELYDRINDVCISPASSGYVRKGLRAAMLPKSQFIIYYRVHPFLIEITAVLHSRAHPNKWRRRK